jgi:signal transduction histidine kinase
MNTATEAASATSTIVSSGVRRNSRRIAIIATITTLALYLLFATIADVVAVNRLTRAIDARLSARLTVLAKESTRGGFPTIEAPSNVAGGSSLSDSSDIDDAPVVAWFVPTTHTGSHVSIVRLDSSSPQLGTQYDSVGAPIVAQLGNLQLRLEGIAIPAGRIIAGASTLELSTALRTLIIIEAALAPLLLGTVFGVATLIGRSAAAPIERARIRQLDFTADASHELRTPLTVIEAEVGLALSKPRSPEAYRDALVRVSGESKRLRTIVEDLLWLARADAPMKDPGAERVELGELAALTVRRFEAIANHSGIALHFSTENRYPTDIIAPGSWVDRLVAVLVDNACRYTNPGGHIEVSTTATDLDVTLTVDDSGPGIDEEQRDLIFERFHRGSSVPGGAGLGLSIANVVVEQTGGTWSVGRAPLGGARFVVTWPRPEAV